MRIELPPDTRVIDLIRFARAQGKRPCMEAGRFPVPATHGASQ